VVEPTTKEDVAIALRVVGENKTPFAVMSGGHASNVGFSSVGIGGVHFWLGRLDTFEVDFKGGSVEVGFGLVSFFPSSFSFFPFFFALSFFLPFLPPLGWDLKLGKAFVWDKGGAICHLCGWCGMV